jgi:hypothetical protein
VNITTVPTPPPPTDENFWYKYLLVMLGREVKSSWVPIRCKITWYLWNSFVPAVTLCAQPNAHVAGDFQAIALYGTFRPDCQAIPFYGAFRPATYCLVWKFQGPVAWQTPAAACPATEWPVCRRLKKATSTPFYDFILYFAFKFNLHEQWKRWRPTILATYMHVR